LSYLSCRKLLHGDGDIVAIYLPHGQNNRAESTPGISLLKRILVDVGICIL
jgi:hypothetical protein